MELSLIILEKIISLYLILLLGVIIVKCGILKTEDSKILSVLSIYIICPCMILSSVRTDAGPELFKGMLLSLIAAFIMMGLAIIITTLLAKPLKLEAVEQVALEYPNAGNLILPIVTSVLGQEYVVYALGFVIVHTILTWTHMRCLLSGELKPDFKKIILNTNIIAIIIAFIILLFRIELPYILDSAISDLGSMIGPVSMLITGMIIGNMDLKEVFTYKRVWLVTIGRLIVIPIISLLVLKFSPLKYMAPDGEMILLVTLLGASSCTASYTVQLSQVYGSDEKYASSINVVTTLLCVITIPVMVILYQL